MVTVPFPCNCIQMSLTAEAIQNSNTIPKRDPINYTAHERSFCKVHLFTLQSATTQKSRLNYQARAAALLLCSITSPCRTRIFNAKRVITLGAVSVPPGCGMRQLCSGRTRSLLQDCSAEQLCPASPLGAGLLEPERRKQHRQETSTPEIPGCRYPIVFSFPPHAVCWMFKTYRKIAPVIQQQISDAQKQNTKTAA